MFTDWAPGAAGNVPRDKLLSFSLIFDERGRGPENFLGPIFLEIVPALAILVGMASAGICFLSRAQEDI